MSDKIISKDRYELHTPVTVEEYDRMLTAYNSFASPEETFGDFIVSCIMQSVAEMMSFEQQAEEQSEKDCLWEAKE